MDARNQMTVDETNLYAAGEARHTVRLRPDWAELVEAFQELGPVEVRTENRSVTHIKRGEFDNVSFEGPIGLVLAGDIDLRLFTHHWKWARAIRSEAKDAIEIYDRYGRCVFELRCVGRCDAQAFVSLVDAFAAEEFESVEPDELPDEPPMQVEDVDDETAASFAQAWRDMEDTHEFFGMLREHGLERHVALELAPDGFAVEAEDGALHRVFELAEASQTPIMVFVSSGGCVQIHTGTVRVEHLDEAGMRVEGPNFELRVDLTQLADAWVVKKPTVDGIVTSLEVFDRRSEMAFQVFGERKPGKPELEAWREIMAQLAP
jgi:putative hemin transport protein